MSVNIRKTLDQNVLQAMKEDYLKSDKNTVLRHALSKSPIDSIVYNNSNSAIIKQTFSIELKTMPATNQKLSGRCWIFAALNLLREEIGNKCNIDSFELSQNFIGFYDKVEKFNFLLTEIIEGIELKSDDRLLCALLETGIADGGQWDMFVNVVKKYGICPKSAFEETYQAHTTKASNDLLNAAAREFTYLARKLHQEDRDSEIDNLKNSYLQKAYNLLVSSYGLPPSNFDFEYKDSKGQYHCEKGYTPLSFFNEYIGDQIDEYQSIIIAPTKDKDYLKTYTIEHLGNVVGGRRINHLNLRIKRVKELVIKSLKSNQPVWFGSDVAHYADRENGVLDDGSFDYESAFGIGFNFGKAAMLDYHQSAMNHAMLITGVTLDSDGNPTKWKIENSWGDARGEKGYFVATDSWFSTFVYQVVINKKLLNTAELNALDNDPIVLPLWDPFGTLAD